MEYRLSIRQQALLDDFLKSVLPKEPKIAMNFAEQVSKLRRMLNKRRYPKTIMNKNSREYKIWINMIGRCENKKAINYEDYGGRGITVSTEWHDYWNFIDDMMPVPFEGAELDRIDNNKGYSKENCRWVTHSENQRNRRTNVRVKYNKEEMLLIEFCEKYNLPYIATHARIFILGWSLDRCITTPVKTRS
jgi:hypothetical protein